jgi:hypothetical protein
LAGGPNTEGYAEALKELYGVENFSDLTKDQ